MQLFNYIPLLFPILASQAQAYLMEFHDGENCGGTKVGEVIGGPGIGCRTDHAGQAKSVTTKSTGPVDDPFMIVFFDSTDCDPRTIITQGDEISTPCSTVNYKSYEIWNVFE